MTVVFLLYKSTFQDSTTISKNIFFQKDRLFQYEFIVYYIFKMLYGKRKDFVETTRILHTKGKSMRSYSWKWALWGVVFILFSVSLIIGYDGSESVQNPRSDRDVELMVWAWDIAASALAGTVQPFERAHPNVKVHIVDIPWNQVSEQVLNSLITGTELPDIVAVGNGSVLQSWFKHFPNTFVDMNNYGAADFAGKFDPNKWNASQYDGKILAMPWDSAPVGLFYRQDLFDQAGIDIRSIHTWEDWYTAGLQLKKLIGPDIKLMTADLTKSARLYIFMLQQQRISIFDANGNITVTDPKAVRALTLLQKMTKQDLILNTPDWKQDNIDAVKQNKVASIINGVWFTGLLEQFFPEQEGKWRLMLPPSFDENEIQVGNIGGSFLLISSNSKSPEKAYEFIKNALATEQGQLSMFTNYRLFPSFLPTYEDSAFHAPVDYFGGQKIWRVFVESVANIPTINYTDDYQVALECIQEELNKVLFENADPTHALEAAARKIAAKTGRNIAHTK
jgi:lactose/L-arabinose transport system substrate-binding protein